MVTKGDDFCSGFTLRAQTLILLHSILTIDSFLFWAFLPKFLTGEYASLLLDYFLFGLIIPNNRLIGYAFGIVASSIGLFSIHKNKPILLMFFILYFFCYLIYYGVSIILMIASPSIYKEYIFDQNDKIEEKLEKTSNIPAIFAYLFFMAHMVYFARIVKNCMDNMLKQNSSNDSHVEMIERKPNYDCTY